MAVRSDVMSRPPRAPLTPRSRRRWAAVAGIAGVWALFLAETGSAVAGTVLFLMLVVAAIGFMVALRCLGISRDHPWAQRIAARPWRDGQDVLQLGLRHLPEVFIVTPSGSLLAPNVVELRMNPADLASLTELMDLDLINSSSTEVYQSQVAARGVDAASAGPVGVSVIGDPAVLAGRYQLRQGRPLPPLVPQFPVRPAAGVAAGTYGGYLARPAAGAASGTYGGYLARPAAGAASGTYGGYPARPAAGAAAGTCGGQTKIELGVERTVAAGSLTVAETVSVPLLRLVTNGCVAETCTSGARAGRDFAAELGLPAVPTVSRVHATFTFAENHWRITGLGRNGVMLNGTPLAGEQVIRDGDSISWGMQPGALASRVEIGWAEALPSHPGP